MQHHPAENGVEARADLEHAEGTFMHSREAIDHQFKGVAPEERNAIVGGTLGGLLGVSRQDVVL